MKVTQEKALVKKGRAARFADRVSLSVSVLSLTVYLFYTVYKTVKKSGNYNVNLVLAIITAAYLLFVVVSALLAYKKGGAIRPKARSVYKISKILMLLLSALMTVYGFRSSNGGLPELIFAAFSVGSLTVQLCAAIFMALISAAFSKLQKKMAQRKTTRENKNRLERTKPLTEDDFVFGSAEKLKETENAAEA